MKVDPFVWGFIAGVVLTYAIWAALAYAYGG